MKLNKLQKKFLNQNKIRAFIIKGHNFDHINLELLKLTQKIFKKVK